MNLGTYGILIFIIIERGERVITTKHFFILDSEGQDYRILYHAPSSKLAKISKDASLEEISDEYIYEKYPKLKEYSHSIKKREFGKGRVGITFMSSRTCNLGCKYCFAGEGEYGNNVRKPKQLNSHIYMESIKRATEMYPEGVKSISFFGGEPLINIEEIERFVPECIEYYKLKGLPIPKMAVDTNATLIDEGIAEFLHKYGIGAGLSLDGPKEINDLGRVAKNGDISVYDTVVEKVELLKKHGIGYIFQVTLNKNHIQQYKPGKVKEWLDNIQVFENTNLSFVPVESDDIRYGIKDEKTLKAFDMLVRELANYYIEELYKDNPRKIATGIVAPLVQVAKNKYQESCAAGHWLFIDTDGNIYPCQMFCNDDEFLLGNVLDERVEIDKVNEYANINRMDGESCKQCIAQNICSVWCKGMQYLSNKDMYATIDARCTFQRAITEECIKALVRMEKGTEDYKRFWKNLAAINKNERKLVKAGE
ncbi:MAG: radical SAM protein [Clostridia bacterium]